MKTATVLSQAQPLIALIGPTAVGKTALVLELAEELGAEVVSVDSMQVYRRLDIGTAKPSAAEQARVRHHLLDLVDPDQDYNVNRFIDDAEQACRDITVRGHLPLLSGGTGLYLKAFQEGLFDIGDDEFPGTGTSLEDTARIRAGLKEELAEKGREALYARLMEIDPQAAARIHPHDTSRLLRGLEIFAGTGKTWTALLARQQKINSGGKPRRTLLKIGLTDRREALYGRINKRAAAMLTGGLIEEVEGLLNLGYSPDLKPLQAIGYRQVIDHLLDRCDFSTTLELLARDTRRYAKRQLTWFGRDPEIQWFRPEEGEEILNLIRKYLVASR